MFTSLTEPEERPLEPIERISEILFGLIMVLTFTCSFSVAEAGREEVRTMLIGALGCNLAWGVIDAVFYLMACFSSQGSNLLRLRAVRRISNASGAYDVIADALPPLVASILTPADFELIRQRLNALPEPPRHPRLHRDDWLGSLGVFLIVFVSTLPVILPFVFIDNIRLALRISNLVAVVLLFIVGYRFGHHIGHHPWRTGLTMVAVGSVMVAITISLGG
jgi:VIT family